MLAASRLVVAEPADRRHLEPRVGAGRVHLDVEAAVMALPHVARADLDDPVGQAESGDGPLGTADHVVEQVGRLFGRGERQDLDLVELVGTQHAPRVTTCRTGLAPIRRAVRHHPDRQFVVVEGLAGVDRGERHLGRGDAPQVVTFDRVRVVGELGELPGGGERGRGHERRRPDLLERIGVEIEPVLTQRPAEGGAGASLHREHRTGDLRGALVVEDPERVGSLPVRDPLVVGIRVEQADRTGDERVVVVARTVGRIGVRQVGDAQQQVAQGGIDLVVLRGERTFAVAEGSTLGLQCLGAVDVAGPAERSDLFRDDVDPGPDRIALLGDRAQPLVESGGVAHVVEQRRAVTAGERGLDHRQVGAQEPLVDHDVAGYLPPLTRPGPVER